MFCSDFSDFSDFFVASFKAVAAEAVVEAVEAVEAVGANDCIFSVGRGWECVCACVDDATFCGSEMTRGVGAKLM